MLVSHITEGGILKPCSKEDAGWLRHPEATKAWWGCGCNCSLVVLGASSEGVMAAATDLSCPNSNDRSLEQSCSPNVSREVLCEIFRSLHTLAGQVSGLLGAGDPSSLSTVYCSSGGGATVPCQCPASALPVCATRPLRSWGRGRSPGLVASDLSEEDGCTALVRYELPTRLPCSSHR